MFGYVNKMFIGLLSTCATAFLGESLASNSEGHKKYISLNDSPCQTLLSIYS